MKLASIFLFCSRIIKPKESALTNARKSLIGAVFCIALSLIPLTVVLVVTDGMIEGITNRIVGLSSFHMQVAQVRTYNDTDENFLVLQEIAESVKKHPNVINTFIERQGTVLAAGKKGRSGATVRAVEPRLFTENKAFAEYLEVIEGSATFSSGKSCVIGKKIAELLGLSVGDTVRLISTKTSLKGAVIPKISTFKVEGIV
jgi:lipoprotein-releasing system permease protein